MNIAIIGSGNVGGALAQQWINKKHSVLIGAQFPLSKKNIELATKIGEDRFTSINNAIVQSDVVVIAIPPTAIFDIIAHFDDAANKVIIDATNSIKTKPLPYATVYHALQDKTKAQVVKCFNTTGFENMLHPVYNNIALDMFMAGNSTKAKAIAQTLALDCGFENCYDFGGEDKVELLEQFALSWINLAIMQGMGRDIGFKLIKR